MPSPKLGLASIIGLQHPIEELLDIAQSLRLDGVEITGRAPHLSSDATDEQLRALRRATESRGLEVLAYGSYFCFRGHFDRAQQDAAVATAAALGSSRLRVWAESPTGLLDQPGFEALLGLLQACCDQAADQGIDVLVERHADSFADSAQRVGRLIAAVDRPNFALNYQPLDHLPATTALGLPQDARRLAGKARYCHLKNYRPVGETEPTLELGAPLEHGALDYRKILRSLFSAGYEGPLVLEFTSDDRSKPLHARLAADVAFVRKTLEAL